MDTSIADTNNEVVTSSNTPINEVENTIINEKNNKKEITKQYNSTKKTTSKTYTVNDFNTLHNALTSNTYSTLTLNIKSNIKLTESTTLNSAIKTLTINGNGKTINGNYQYQFLNIESDSKVTVKNIKIINCYSYGSGGAIYNKYDRFHSSILTITNTTLNNNNATRYGGAIYVLGNKTTIQNTIFKNNRAQEGLAIYSQIVTETKNISYTVNVTYHSDGYRYGPDGRIISGPGYYTVEETRYREEYIIYGSNINIKNNIFQHNQANKTGKAIIINGTNITIKNNLNADTSIDSSTIYINGTSGLISNNRFYDGRTLFKHTSISNVKLGTTVKVVGRLLSEDKGNAIKYAPVTLKINSKTYKLKTDGAGYVKLNYTVNNYDDQKITFKYAGNDNYLPCTNTTTFKVKQPTWIKIASMSNVKYGSTVKLVGRLLYNGSTAVKYTAVNVTVNGKTYKVKTDGAGYIRLNYTVNNYNDQKITFKFAGNSLYLASSNSTTFKVKQPTWIKHASIGKVKQGSTVKIVGRVLYNGTSSVKYVPVNVTVNGKGYTLKTDGAGYFRLNYTAKTLGTITFTSNFGETKLYQASTNSTKFTVVKS